MELAFDALRYRYPSRRPVVYGSRGMVCASQPLAAQAGLDLLKKGGNAIDAAIATAACLTVMEPTSNGIGGDAFALVWVKDELFGLNASGPCPMAFDADLVRAKHGAVMPRYGWTPVTVPGAPSAWAELSRRFGRLPFRDVLAPAIGYAREGHPVSPTIAYLWGRDYKVFSAMTGDPFAGWAPTFAPEGRAPLPGEMIRLPDHADTLEALAETVCDSFYRGETAGKIDAFSRKTGGFLRKEDLEAYRAEWVDPISTGYRGYTVWEIPPNGHGIVALMALNILEGYSFGERDTAETFHRQFEAMKLAFADGQRYVADSRFMKVTSGQMLSRDYAERRRAAIGATASDPAAGNPASGGTVYLCTADGEGNMVSYIQSNYTGFGSGIVVPGTGVALQNRGYGFSLDPADANCAAPGKKSYHTIIPGFLSKEGRAIGPFGVMGGFMQPQGHVQVVTGAVDFGMNPQESLDAPRWQWVGGRTIEVERAFPHDVAEQLIRLGHDIRVVPESFAMGRGQIIWRDGKGVLVGGTEPRTDGACAAW